MEVLRRRLAAWLLALVALFATAACGERLGDPPTDEEPEGVELPDDEEEEEEEEEEEDEDVLNGDDEGPVPDEVEEEQNG